MIDSQEFQSHLNQAIQDNQIVLPTLPEVALRIREVVESENSTAHQIADTVTSDPALAARLLQVANSPLYRGRVPIETVQMAVARLGNRMVRDLVVSLAMRQMFQATSDVLDRQLRAVWQQSVQVAAICRALAQGHSNLNREEAMLAGLIHNIGALPILTFSEFYPGLLANENALGKLLTELTPVIGGQILRSWEFPEALIEAAENHLNFEYDSGPDVDYIDLVLVARLEQAPPQSIPASIPAFQKLGLEPEVEIITIEGVDENMQEMQSMLC